jgi:UDP-N-acetylglucosamine:LPS N-acetylglucosamine transferase
MCSYMHICLFVKGIFSHIFDLIILILIKLFGVNDIKIVFSESFACVDHLSLSGKLLYPIVDMFFVQWPDLQVLYPKSIYTGRLQQSPSNNNNNNNNIKFGNKGTVFVTVGSTCFDKLIKSIDKKEFIQKLNDMGFSKLVVQIGRGAYVPTLDSDTLHNFIFECYTFKESLQQDIANADLIISHAGTYNIFKIILFKHTRCWFNIGGPW